MAIMDLFTSLQTIINERSAKKVRQSIHDGIFRANQVVDANKNSVDQVAIRQDAVEDQFDALQRSNTEEAYWGAEIVVASDGEATLDKRLTRDKNKITAQLDQKVELDGYYYSEIQHTKGYVHNTNYYIARIPNTDSKGYPIKLKHGIALDNMAGNSLETARNFSERHKASLVVNAGIFNMSTGSLQGISIIDGTVLPSEPNNYYRLGIKDDNTLVIFPPTATAQEIINAGCNNAISAWYPLIQNGASVGTEISSLIDNWNVPYQRQIIGQIESTKEIIIFSCDGKNIDGNTGMTYPQCIDILLGLGVTLAYTLDGGGSVTTVRDNILINQITDDDGFTERPVADFLYVVKEHEDNFTDDLSFKLSDAFKRINENKLLSKSLKISDSGWINLTLTSGSSVSGHTIQYRKIGNRVSLRGRVTGLSASSAIGALPEGYRPTRELVYLVAMGATNIGKVSIPSSGQVNIAGSSVAFDPSLYFVLDTVSFYVD